jgi:membrane protein YdbS with pleckstrin-like domain
MNLELEPQVVPQPPVSGPAAWERLDPRYLTLERRVGAAWSAAMAAFWLLVFVGITILGPLPREYRVPLFAFWAIATAAHIAWYQYRPALTYRHSSFRLDGDGIEIRRGAIFRRVISVPRSRVQHTDVSQGPMERRFELGTLHIYTAGVSHALIPLPGLSHARALEIRDSLLPRDRVART